MKLILFQILAVLRGGARDAPQILDALRRVGGEEAVPSLPALYRHLKRATERGWIEVEALDDDHEGAGRPRRQYALTRRGRDALTESARRLVRFTGLATEGRVGPGDGHT